MKALRLFFLALLVAAGLVATAAPLIAASQNPTHPASIQFLDANPAPTPTPRPGDPPGDCTSSGC